MFDWYWVAGLAAVAIAFRLIRPVLAYVIAPAVSAKALATQPDTIHLEPGENAGWGDPATRDRMTAELRALGFVEAGTHVVRELPPVRLRLFANAAESLMAVVCEHPQRGVWLELACRGTDGTSMTWSSLPPSGLDPRPGHPVHHLPRVSTGAMCKSALRERPVQPLQPVAVSSVGPDFERAWAESMAWRKEHGVSRAEVARASVSGGTRKAA
jgi:hypothetical protein